MELHVLGSNTGLLRISGPVVVPRGGEVEFMVQSSPVNHPILLAIEARIGNSSTGAVVTLNPRQ